MNKGFSTILLIPLMLIILVFGGVAHWVYKHNYQNIHQINSFEDCQKAGYPVGESYPAQCWTPDGKHFVQQLSYEEKRKLAPSTDPTVNWKVYTNKKYGFEFKYPNNWEYTPQNFGDEEAIIMGPLTDTNHIGEKVEPYPSQMMVFATQPLTDQSVEKTKELPAENTKWEEIKIAGLDAKKVSHLGCISGECMSIIFANKERIFDFQIENAQKSEFQEHLTTVATTFRFLDDETAEWKTYQNGEMAFSLKYPPGWTVKENSEELTVDFFVSKADEMFLPTLSISVIKDGIANSDPDYENMTTPEEIKVDGRVGLLRKDKKGGLPRAGGFGYVQVFEVKYGKGLMVISSERDNPNLNKIIASLKFL